MASLDKTEIESIVSKIRDEYQRYSKENPKLFSLLGFEERYTQILKIRGNVQAFLQQEVEFLEQLKKKHQSLKEKREAAKGDTINRILDEHEKQLEKYNRVDFHPLARKEMRYFYGAMISLAEEDLPVLVHIFRGTPEWELFRDAITNLERIGISRRGYPSIRINEHIKRLLDANGNQSLMEKDSQQILKDTCHTLYNVHESIQKCIQENRVSENLKVHLEERDHPKAFGKYENILFPDAIEQIMVHIRQIISDFRMDSIVGIA